MPKLTIDGIEVEVEEGLNLIQAAERVGIEVPHFCYHPALSVVAQCRQCLVEVEGVPKVMPGCNTFVRDGMVVKTNTEKAIEARKATVEFTLINHPLDCPICDKGGECPLQLTTVKHGPGYSRFGTPYEKKVRQKYYLSDRIMYDPNRCIMCTRCVRFTSEVTKTGELGYNNRGFRKRIVTFPGKPLDNELAGNVIDLCPVGALLNKGTLHEERVWYWKFTESVCTLCSTGCNITVGVDPRKGKVARVTPRYNKDVNGHWICDRGRYGFEAVQEQKRIKDPIIKVKKGFDITEWQGAYELIKQNFETTGGFAYNNIGIIGSPRLTNEELFLLKKLRDCVRARGLVSHIGHAAGEKKLGLISSDPYPNSKGVAALNIDHTPGAVDDLIDLILDDKITRLIIVENDLFEIIHESQHYILTEALQGLEFLLVIDTKLTETMKYADLILPAATAYERDGTFTNDNMRVQRLSKSIDPPGSAKPQWEIINDLIQLIGNTKSDFDDPGRIFNTISQNIPTYSNMTYDNLGNAGISKQV
ncbi:MAG: molybdopterin-dependent oxidoreductase [Candidatus Dadabacteria bacterium]|nr:molybdopterin-dependent oxidoreductase [Candidatus Dadabacteria bacterium]